MNNRNLDPKALKGLALNPSLSQIAPVLSTRDGEQPRAHLSGSRPRSRRHDPSATANVSAVRSTRQLHVEGAATKENQHALPFSLIHRRKGVSIVHHPRVP